MFEDELTVLLKERVKCGTVDIKMIESLKFSFDELKENDPKHPDLDEFNEIIENLFLFKELEQKEKMLESGKEKIVVLKKKTALREYFREKNDKWSQDD